MMKRFMAVLTVVILVLLCLCFVSCDSEDQLAISMPDAVLQNVENVGDVYYLIVPNNQAIVNFNNYVQVSKKATFTVSTDMSGNNVITSKTVNPEAGEFYVYYVNVSDRKNNNKVYLVALYRNTMCRVSFNTNGGTACSSQTVEEGDHLENVPVSTKTGYSCSWDYNFENAIVEDTVVNAIWTPNQYSIVYDANGGTISASQITVDYDSEVKLATPQRNGYRFLGWYFNNKKITDGKWNYTSDVVLTAQWEPISYSISYVLNGGTNSAMNPKSFTADNGSSKIYPATRIGYTFAGWTMNNSGTVIATETVGAGVYEDITLTAKWTANQYNVTFDANGGSLTTTQQQVTYDSEVSLPTPISTRDGYVFDCWLNGDKPVTNGMWTIASDVKLVARYKAETYGISYNLNGGNVNPNPSTYAFDQSVTLKNPGRTGYTFVGWSTDEATTPTFDVVIPLNSKGTKTFTANWEVNTYSVSFDVNGGEGSFEPLSIVFDSQYTLDSPTKTGYSFAGWTYAGQKVDTNGTWKIGTDATLIASWTPNTNTLYTVNYYIENLNDDDYQLKDSIKYTGTSDAEVVPPVKNYSNFVSPKSQTVKILADGSLVVNYYYTRARTTITFVTNGGNSIEPTELKCMSTQMPIPEREGYTFGGWFSDAKLTNQVDTVPKTEQTLYAWWAEETKPCELYYEIVNDTIKIEGYLGESTSLRIPSYIANIRVSTIGVELFGCESIKSFYVPIEVTNIQRWACAGMPNLEEITLPYIPMYSSSSSVYVSEIPFSPLFIENNSNFEEQLSSQQFYSTGYRGTMFYCIPCSLKKITILSGNEVVDGAFAYCSKIEEIHLPDTITRIGEKAFYQCKELKNISIPNNVEYIGNGAFSQCDSLTYNTFDNGYYLGDDDNPYVVLCSTTSKTIRTINIHKDTKIVANEAMTECSGLTELVFPSGVLEIGRSACWNCISLKYVSFPASLKNIDRYAFYGTPSKTINISDIAAWCSVIIDETVSNNLNIETLKINNVETSSLVIPTGVAVINGFAFSDIKNITSITLPSSVTEIGEHAFAACSNLKEINFSTGLITIGEGAFARTACTEIVLPDGLKEIKKSAFSECNSLVKVTIPNNLTIIEEYAFSGCGKLQKVVLGYGLSTLSGSVFYKCTSHILLDFKGTRAEYNALIAGRNGNYSFSFPFYEAQGGYTIVCCDD